ncbi:MAG: alpha/beta hydrolase [Leucobacter sp.]
MMDWRPDVLGEGYECCDLELGDDHEGPVVATLVRSLPQRRAWWQPRGWWESLTNARSLIGVDVLYVHGWSDYFFQRRVAEFWTNRGARFYALDLRKYGRSLRPGQTPGYIGDLKEYDTEIHHALEAMLEGERRAGDHQPARSLVLMGHSTGGLVLTLWANRHPGIAAALVLNSPWLEFQLSSRIRHLVRPFVDLGARFKPHEAMPQLDYGFYSRAQREVADDTEPLDVNHDWRPAHAPGVTVGWLRAILDGHSQVDDGLDIDAPVCVLLSKRSEFPARWSEELTRADTVLDVDEVARSAVKLGNSVTVERVDGALHDVFLSRHEAREEAYERLGRWVSGWAASRRI